MQIVKPGAQLGNLGFESLRLAAEARFRWAGHRRLRWLPFQQLERVSLQLRSPVGSGVLGQNPYSSAVTQCSPIFLWRIPDPLEHVGCRTRNQNLEPGLEEAVDAVPVIADDGSSTR